MAIRTHGTHQPEVPAAWLLSWAACLAAADKPLDAAASVGQLEELRMPKSLHLPASTRSICLQIKLADVPVTVQEGQQGSGGAPAGSPPAPRVLVRKRSDRMGHRGGPMMGPGGMEGPYGMASGINGQYRCGRDGGRAARGWGR